jgi:hypothetical protein
VRVAVKIRKLFELIERRWNRIEDTRIDFYSSKYRFAEKLFWVLLGAYGTFIFYDVFQASTYMVRLTFQPSLQSFLGFFSWFLLYFFVTVIVLAPLLSLKKAIRNTLTRDFIQAPQILRLNRISKKARTIRFGVFIISYLVQAMAMLYLTAIHAEEESYFRPFPFVSSTFMAVATSSLVVEALMGSELSSDNRVFLSLAYLCKEESLERLTVSIELISKEIVENLQKIFLYSYWRFTKRINLWPQFQVIFLALVSGNEEERTAAKDLLLEIMKAISKPTKESRSICESYRRVYDLVDRFQIRMKSLSALRDKAMFEGRPEVRGLNLRERIDAYEAPIMIALTAIGIVVAIVLSVIPK